jgi:hypothetical protein
MMAIETDQRGEAPSGNNSFWFQGGGWFSVVTDGLPTLYDQQALIFPVGYAGKRSMNQMPPIPGRKWSAGDVNAVATAEWLGQWLYGVMGSASHNTVPSTDAVLMATSGIESDGQDFTLTTQPSDGGAVLQIPVDYTGVTTGSGRLTVKGTDAEGNAASETLSWDAGSPVLYTRTSFSAVTTITVNSAENLGGSIAVNGIKEFRHTISPASVNPTFSVERIGDPSAGAASKSFMHTGMGIQTIGLDSPAATRDGIISVNSTWEGDPTATCTAKSIQEASAVRQWPAWILNISRDNAIYLNPTNHSMEVNSGVRNYRSAAGVQYPQGTFFGGRELTQSIALLLDDESEFNRWRGASKQNLALVWTTPWILNGTNKVRMEASLTDTYIENVATGEDDDAFIYNADMRNLANATTDVATLLIVDNIPPNAYGASTVIN